ncbi:MAG: transcriptional repressor [Phycisphaerales bacterium]|nr:transcriptional repressor [Phycisphaerales bacterium]
MALGANRRPDGDDLEIIEPLCAVFRRRLKSEGAKYTPERAEVLDAIVRIEGIFEAEDLLERLQAEGRRVSKATVYRTLKIMQDAGIVQRVLSVGDQARYQLAYGRAGTDQLVRLDGGRVESIEPPGLKALCEQVCAQRGVKYQGHRLQVFATAPERGG